MASPDTKSSSLKPISSTQSAAQTAQTILGSAISSSTQPVPGPGSWNGQLNDPNGVVVFLEAEASIQSGTAGVFGSWNFSMNAGQWSNANYTYGAYAFTPSAWETYCSQSNYGQYGQIGPAAAGSAVQNIIAYNAANQLFAMYGRWDFAAQGWYYSQWAGNTVYQSQIPPGGVVTMQQYSDQVIQAMQKFARAAGDNVPSIATMPGGDYTAGANYATQTNAASVTNLAGQLQQTPEPPLMNGQPVKPSGPLDLDFVKIRGQFMTKTMLTDLGDVSLRDLISDCQISWSVTEVSSATFTFQSGDAVVSLLGIGIGEPSYLEIIEFCDSNGDTLWPLAISQVQMTTNAAQQPALTVTCTSYLLQSWQAVFPPVGSPINTSPTAWLMNQAYLSMGKTEFANGKAVFVGQRTKIGGDPNFVVNAPSPQQGTLQSTTYSVAQAVQSDQAFYLFDSFGTVWFGSPLWIVQHTLTLYLEYCPAGQKPFLGTKADNYIISPVGPPQLGQTIQTVPQGWIMEEQLQVVNQITVALPQYMACQVHPGMQVVLAGTGYQYDTVITGEPNYPYTPPQPYMVTEVTGTVDGGLSTWNITFEEAILPSQPQTSNPVTGGNAGVGATGGGFQYANPTKASYVDQYTGKTLSGNGDNSHLQSEFVTYLQSQLGATYVYSAPRIYTATTFDCSSLVWWALAHVGIQFGTWTGSQVTMVTPMTAQQAYYTPGALLFGYYGAADVGGNATTPGHVAVSLGNGYLIEAPQTNETVHIVPISLVGNQIAYQGQSPVFTHFGYVPTSQMTYDIGISSGTPLTSPIAGSSSAQTSPDRQAITLGVNAQPGAGTGITTTAQFATALLTQLGITPTSININLIRAWEDQEGQWEQSLVGTQEYATAMYNPLNLTPLISSNPDTLSPTLAGFPIHPIYDPGDNITGAFDGWTQGVQATALCLTQTQTLSNNGTYGGPSAGWNTIVSALQTSNPTAFFSAVESWNSGNPSYSSDVSNWYYSTGASVLY